MLTIWWRRLPEWCGLRWFVVRSKRPSPLVSDAPRAPLYRDLGLLARDATPVPEWVRPLRGEQAGRRIKRVDWRPVRTPWGAWGWELDIAHAEFWPDEAVPRVRVFVHRSERGSDA